MVRALWFGGLWCIVSWWFGMHCGLWIMLFGLSIMALCKPHSRDEPQDPLLLEQPQDPVKIGGNQLHTGIIDIINIIIIQIKFIIYDTVLL